MDDVARAADFNAAEDEIEYARSEYLSLCEKAKAAAWNSDEASALQEAADKALYVLNLAEERLSSI